MDGCGFEGCKLVCITHLMQIICSFTKLLLMGLIYVVTVQSKTTCPALEISIIDDIFKRMEQNRTE